MRHSGIWDYFAYLQLGNGVVQRTVFFGCLEHHTHLDTCRSANKHRRLEHVGQRRCNQSAIVSASRLKKQEEGKTTKKSKNKKRHE